MKKIKPDYAKLEVDSIMFAYRKRHPEDVFPVYYLGYDKNWDEHQWTDGEGETFGDMELMFVSEKDWQNQRQNIFVPFGGVEKAKKVTEAGKKALREMIDKMYDLWVSPYGEVIKCEPGTWKHATTAGKILNERYGYNLDTDYPELGWDDELEHKGWIRWTSCTGCGWILRPDVKPTTDQLNKIFELTGEIPDDIW